MSPHALTHQAILPEGWPRPKGYANGVVAQGRMLFIAGMIGWDPQGKFPGDDFAAQVRQALANVAEVLQEAGGRPDNLVRMTWYVTDKREYLAAAADIGRAFREIIGNYNIAMTAVEVKALIEDRATFPEAVATAASPIDDVRGTAAYRRHALRVLAARGAERCLA